MKINRKYKSNKKNKMKTERIEDDGNDQDRNRPLMASSVAGACQESGPTFDCQIKRYG